MKAEMMSSKQRPKQNEVIDLKEVRDQGRDVDRTNKSGLSRKSPRHSPPRRSGQHLTILVGEEAVELQDQGAEPMELRRSMFESEQRVISVKTVDFHSGPADRSLGKPNGTIWQRLLKRRS